MLDINYIRENPDKVKKGVAAKQFDPKIVTQLLSLDEKRRNLIAEIESLRAKRNKIANSLKINVHDSIKVSENAAIEEGRKVKEELKTKEPELAKVEQKYKQALSDIPNLPADDVKEGQNESENEVLRKWGKVPQFNFKVKDHLELGERLGIIDVARAAKVSGTRFGYLKGDGVLLEFALIQLALEHLTKEGFIPVIPPTLIKKESMAGMGYLEHGGEEDMYVLDKDNLVLVGTSEQSIGPMHSNEVLAAKKLPLRYMGFSSCFRREAGSYGKDTRGIFRVHQFDKVEMFSFCDPLNSDKEHEFLLSLEEKFLQALGLHYQVVKMCSGDLGMPAARKYDLEVWLPGQNRYREVTSTSTTTDYQARRLNIKYQLKGQTLYVHMLNGTAFAVGRMIIAILENNQQADGSVKVPKVLQKYIDRDIIMA
jgi:seryl-tRNA synthetase